MSTEAPMHFVFVDFENVPTLDLLPLEGKPVRVMLLIGKLQTKLSYELVEQIHRMASQLELVKLEISGRNALDMTLCYYLGQAVRSHPAIEFYIISSDTGFDPLISHAQGKGYKIQRRSTIEALPFIQISQGEGEASNQSGSPAEILAVPDQTPEVRPSKPAPAAEPKSGMGLEVAPTVRETRFEKLVRTLRKTPETRPKSRASLRAYLRVAFGGKLSNEEVNAQIDLLVSERVVIVHANNRVTYPPH